MKIDAYQGSFHVERHGQRTQVGDSGQCFRCGRGRIFRKHFQDVRRIALGVTPSTHRCGSRLGSPVAKIGACENPGMQSLRLLFRERIALGGHNVHIVRRQDRQVIERAFFRLARHQNRTVLAALQNGFRRIESKFPFLLFRTVAGNAPFLQNRPDGGGKHTCRPRSWSGRRIKLGPFRNPLVDRLLLGIGQGITLGRHDIHIIGRQRHEFIEGTLFRFSRHHDSTVLTTLQDGFLGIQSQFTFLLLGSVAAETALLQDGMHVFRKARPLRVCGHSRDRPPKKECSHQASTYRCADTFFSSNASHYPAPICTV